VQCFVCGVAFDVGEFCDFAVCGAEGICCASCVLLACAFNARFEYRARRLCADGFIASASARREILPSVRVGEMLRAFPNGEWCVLAFWTVKGARSGAFFAVGACYCAFDIAALERWVVPAFFASLYQLLIRNFAGDAISIKITRCAK